MDKLQVAEFRKTFGDLTEPTEVVRYSRLKGTWYPEGTEPNSADGAACVAYEAEIKYLKSELAARLTTKVGPQLTVHTNAIAAGSGPEHRGVSSGGFGHSTPAPKP